jgi:hypothetical protein
MQGSLRTLQMLVREKGLPSLKVHLAYVRMLALPASGQQQAQMPPDLMIRNKSCLSV